MVVADNIKNYRFYTDSKGHLLSGHEWEEYDATHEKPTGGKLPDGWPEKLEGPLVWTGQELQKTPEKYLYILDEDDKSELAKAIEKFEASDVADNLQEISKETFPLPNLGTKLEQFSKELYEGIGVKLVRGFPLEDYNERQRIIGYLGISSYIGDLRDAQGINRALIHIKSIAHVPKSERAPIAVSQQTTDPQMFHNDAGLDIVSLFVLDVPKSGGESLITSTYPIYNELAQTRPDIISLLADPNEFEFALKAKEGGNMIQYQQGKLYSHFSTRVFIGFGDIPRDERFPPLNERQKEAFGAFNWIGYRNTLTLPIEKGDIEYLNNLHLQHSRLGYEEDAEHRRHVARLWLRNSKYSSKIEYPKPLQAKIDDGFFPAKYHQEIPLNVQEEEDLKKKYKITSLAELYAKPR